jgi:AcrR family transcriptional regulator
MTKQDERRAAILAAAGAVFTERGFHGARTIDVAARANVSKRDLYAAFPSKEDLLTALIAEGAKEMTAPLALAHPESRASFYAALDAFGRQFLERQLSAPRLALLRLMIARAAENPLAAGDADAPMREELWDALGAFFATAAQAGIIGFLPPPRDTAGAYLSILQGDLVMRALMDPSFRPEEEQCATRVRQAAMTVMALEARPARPNR